MLAPGGAFTTCRFFKPTRFSLGTRDPTSKTLLAAGIGLDGLSMTASKQVWSAAVIGVFQSHSKTVGSVGDNERMTFAVPIGFQLVMSDELFGKAVQKSAGKGGNPAEALA